MVEVICKTLTSIINTRLRVAVSLHYYLHGFWQGWGMGKSTLEVKLVHHMAAIFHEHFFQVFLDMKKAYDSLDWSYRIDILRGYGLSANLQRLLRRYCYGKMLVPRSRRYYG